MKIWLNFNRSQPIYAYKRYIKEYVSSSYGEQYGGWRKKQTKNWCDILIVIAKYNKVPIRCYISCYIVLQLLAIILYLLRYQSGDAYIWLGSFLSFGLKLMSSGIAIGLS